MPNPSGAKIGESAPLNLGIKLGGRHIYSLLSVGFETSGGKQRWLAGLGIGVHGDIDERFYIDGELLASHINEDEAWTTDSNVLSSLRVIIGYRLYSHLSVFLGPTFNLLAATNGRAEGFGLFEGVRIDAEGKTVRMWPGLVAGFEI